ncbi:MAG: mandelate racemase/muconate lactonizing enzyme family protein [Bacillati bacterium ANGP1]|uniref:Mandelate racemase/muconate lactonizing enzyme family protein n=1 Tax=Candidatus Segetimicrobium genomatis TaxID=2569760 RepID=A0A537LQ80_9BACT|nr:MAG: mandelate racemase/muconate lactonizing enzyme family protein [Terrabacteria group bacterium ANGP1]TMJ10173.1 MAG: mandelate racemase/muconate lactonizing enzyme family protein [Terrabacteria group bacterium ANGP1]
MRITEVKTYVMGTNWRNLVFVKVLTDEGVYGIGEATLQNGEESVTAYLQAASRRHVIGSDPFNIEDLWLRMFRNDFWRGGVFAYTGISAVEIACWDIIGKVTGQPIYRLLGGAVRDRIPAYGNGWYTVERRPEEFASAAKRAIAKGYQALKVDPFGAGGYELTRKEHRLSVSIVEAIRNAVGDAVEILIEGHGRFSPATAIALAKDLEAFHPGWFEEPVPPENFAELRKAAEKIAIPIATGERCFARYGYRELLESRAADIIQPDVLHAGGLLEVKKIAAMADAYFVTVAPHNSNGPVCTAASVQLGFTVPNFKMQECFDDFVEPYVKEAVPGCPQVVDGAFSTPHGPGLGVDLREDVIEEHPYRPLHFNLWDADWHKRQARSVGL